MTISGVALLAICTLLGSVLGDALGAALGAKANVGGVGIAMILLIIARIWLTRRAVLTPAIKLDIAFWAAMYIPVVVAMAAQQDVVSAVKGGPIVVIAAIGTLLVCFAAVAIINRAAGPTATMDEIEAAALAMHGASQETAGGAG
jgi:malonate transporter MadL subunit